MAVLVIKRNFSVFEATVALLYVNTFKESH